MKATTWRLTTALLLAFGLAAPVEAQNRGKDRDRDEREVFQRSDDRDDDRSVRRPTRGEDDRQRASRRTDRSERGNGPSFCRSGRGHPVFGWDWCRERGWDRSNSRYPVRWEQRTWEDVIFRRDDRSTVLDRRGLDDVLGDVVFGRIDTRRRELGTSGDWLGRWATTSTGRELWVTVGGVPIARLVDRNGDRRVDSVFLAER